MTNYIRNNRMFLSICGISFLLLFTVRTLYTFSARDYHVKNNEKASRLITLPYSPLNRAIKVANYLTNLEIQKLQKEQARIDLKYCGGPCRFVNFLYIREQGKYYLMCNELGLTLLSRNKSSTSCSTFSFYSRSS